MEKVKQGIPRPEFKSRKCSNADRYYVVLDFNLQADDMPPFL
jgi:hypothetical protein